MNERDGSLSSGESAPSEKQQKSEDKFEIYLKRMNSKQIIQLLDLLFENQLIPSAPYPAIRASDHQEESGKLKST